MPLKFSEIVRISLIVLLMITGGGTFISGQTPLVTGEINKYARVTTVGADFVVVDDVSDFTVNDTVMVMQMNGVRINAGQDLDGSYQNVAGTPGKYEVVVIGSINTVSRTVTFTRVLLNAYNPVAKVQLIKVRSYRNAVVNSELTCQAWDSTLTRGGVIAFLVKGVLTLNADINVSGKGFKGGIVAQGNGLCQVTDPALQWQSYNISSLASGYKGEGLAFRTTMDINLYPDYMRGKGANMTGGGGANGHFSGGGGGSNYGEGSVGDVETPSCAGLYVGGRGGYSVSGYPTINTGVFMGGGGGASVYLSTPTTSAGASGGGIIIILADSISGNGRLISAAGGNALANTVTSAGAGGGGAGGSVILSVRGYISNPVLSSDGGMGGNNINQNGAGGGGGGGLIWTTGAFPGTATVAGGLGGTHSAGDPNADGSPGLKRTNLNLPLNGFLFNEIYLEQSLTQLDSICEGMVPRKMTGTRPAGGSGSYTYQWQKSYDNSIWTDVSGTNIDYTPSSVEAVTLWFRRVVDDGAGIVDQSLPVKVVVHPRITGNLVGADTTLCYNQNPTELYNLNSGPSGGTGLYYYQWEQSPDNSIWSDASGIASNPKYDPPALTATTFYRRVVNSGACTDTGSPVTITILPSITNNTVAADQTICQGTLFSNLTGSAPGGGASPTYSYLWMSSTDNNNWSPASAPNANSGYDPQNDSPGTTYYRRMVYSGPENTCQSASNSVTLVCHPSITNNIISAEQTICEGSSPSTLDGTVPANGAGAGTYTYQWMDSHDGSSFSSITGATTEDLTGSALTVDTWYRRLVTSSVCSSTSNDIKITVNPHITNYTIDLPPLGHDTLCTGTTPGLLSGTPAGGLGTFTYSWASSTDNVNFTGLTATTESFQPGNLTSTTWFRRTVSSGACSESSDFRITILPLITGNTVTADQTICNTTAPAPLSGSAPGGGDGQYRYLWEMKEASASEWVAAFGSNNTAGYQPPLLDGTTQFRRYVYSGEADCCTSVSAPLTITVDIMPQNITAGTDMTLLPYQFATILNGDFDGEGTVSWSYDFNSGKGDPVFQTPDEKSTEVRKLGFGDNTFILAVTNGTCVAEETTVTLTVPELVIPQGVTPNNDGINDYFNVEGLEFTRNELVIINTSGAVVYKTDDYRSDDPLSAWTGLDLKGNEVPEGTYYFLLTIRGAQDISVPAYSANISGFIILRR